MLVSHSEKGYRAHCFRDADHSDFESHGIRSLAEIQRHKRELAEVRNKPPHLPSDAVQDIPVDAAWFLKYGISLSVARRYGLGYSEYFNRVILPVLSPEGKLEAVHLRAVRDGDKPKYVNLGRPSPDAMFFGSNPSLSTKLFNKPGYIVVVEDILSAIKVQLAGWDSVSILGSDITDTQVQRILKYADQVYIWFDNDPAGHKGAKDAIKQFKMQGILTLQVTSDADPKTYNREQINALMLEAKLC